MNKNLKKISIVCGEKKLYNLLDEETDQVILHNWCEEISDFINGIALLKINGRWTFLKEDGELIIKEAFLVADPFYNGLARVREKNGLWNFLKKDGSYLSPLWFAQANPFMEGLAVVKLPYVSSHARWEKWNYLTTDGTLFSKEFFAEAWNFKGGFGVVIRNNGLYNILQKDKSFLSPSDQFAIQISKTFPFLVIGKDKMKNYLTLRGTYLSSEWFYEAEIFHKNRARIRTGKGYNYLTIEGEMLSSLYFKSADPMFIDGLAIVSDTGERYNVMREDGTYIREEWFQFAERVGKTIIVWEQGKYNYVGSDGELYFEEWLV